MFNAFRWLSTTLRRPHHQRKTRSARLVLEPLEDRCVPTGGLFVVDNAGDGVDGNHGAGQLTLREAVLLANNNAGADTINFAADITTVTLTDGELLLTDADTTTIGGNSVTIARSTADGTPEFRIVNVAYGASAALSGLTLTNGRADYGGGILNDGTLTVTDSTITANSAVFDGGGIKCIGGTLTVSNSTLSANVVSYAGGGIYNFIGAVTVTNSTLSGNSAGSGGGIANAGGLTVIDSTLSDNSSSSGGGIFNSYTGGLTVTHSTLSANSAIGGGGIFNEGVLTVTHSTLSANTAVESGGGIVNGIINNEIGKLTVTHSTLTANAALADGGGIFNQGVLTVTNSTLSANSAGDSGGGISNFEVGTLTVTNSTLTANAAAESGGGIANLNTVTLNNSIVAGNTLSDGTPADINNTIDTAHNNLIGDADSSGGISHGSNGNLVGNNGSGTRDITTILNTMLANNGGPTRTHALVAGSPAFNAGADALAVDAQGITLQFDQRGDGFSRFVGTVDIGAFEVQDSTPPNTSINEMPSLVSTKTTAIFTFSGTDNFTAPANLTFEVKLDNGTFTLITGNSFTTPTLGLGSHTLQVRAVDQAGNVDASPASYTWTITSVSGPIVVDNAGDGVDGDLGLGQLTLREAVLLANDHTGPDTINFAAGITTVTLTDGELLLTDADTTTIGGHGVTIARSTADGTPQFRIVNVARGASAAMSGLTLTGGDVNGDGGGILNGGTLTVTNSTLTANSASGGNGGGIDNVGTLTVTNSTLSANSAKLFGGGISNLTRLTVTNSTLSANSANFGGGISAGGTETLNNTIVAGNTLSDGTPDDILSTIQTANNNLIGNASSSGGISHGNNGNIVGNNGSGTRDITTILDTTLAFNGGPTRTHALVAGSPAIHAGNDALAVDAQNNALPFDQRGQDRTFDTVDIGAFEARFAVHSASGTTLDVVRGQPLSNVTVATFTPGFSNALPDDFTAFIIWGDGTAPSLGTISDNGDGTFSVRGDHVYDLEGNPQITVTLNFLADNSTTDVQSSARVTVTSLDETTGRLLIGGTPGIDAIVITPTETPGFVQVSINGDVHGPFQAEAIAAYGYGGNDTLRVGTLKVGTRVHRVQVPTLLHGGAGNDKLDALDNKGRTMLVGGAGNDTLTGSKFRDILIGGQGRDSLKGVGGDNILVGDVFAAEDALDYSFVLLGEWARTDLKFTDRKESFAPVFNEQTLVSDTAGDQLFGGAGKDWFLRRRSRPVDVVRDQLPGDIVTGLP